MTKLKFSLFYCLLTVTACKARDQQANEASFLASAQSTSICEDLSGYLIDNNMDYENDLKKEMADVAFGDDFDDIAGVFKRAHKDKNTKPAAKDFLPSELAAILAYTNAGYGPINASLWKRECDKFKVTAKVLASGINRSIGVRGTVYRGGVITQDDLDKKVYEIGNTVIAPAFSSSSLNKSVAERFVRNAFFEIEDAVGGYVRPLSAWGNEEEVTFVPGTQFRVENVETFTSADPTYPTQYKVKLSLLSKTTQKTVVVYHPKSLDKAVLSATDDKAVSTLVDYLSTAAPDGAQAGHLENKSTELCSVIFRKNSGSLQIEVRHNQNSSAELTLKSSGQVEIGSDVYQPNSLNSFINYRIPLYPAVAYQLSKLTNGVANKTVTIYVGFKNDQLEFERVRIATPRGNSTSDCVLN
jgi:hypothetical protein